MSRQPYARYVRYRDLSRVRHADVLTDWLAARVTALTGTGATTAFSCAATTAFTTATPVNFTIANATDIATSATHGLTTGDGPFVVSNSGGALPTGLTGDPTRYWVEVLDTNTFHFHTTQAAALAADPPVDVSDDGTGTHSYAQTTIITDATHGLTTGDGPFALSTSGTLPAGLSADPSRYWVEVIDANTFYLHTSQANALAAATPVDVGDAGTGTQSYAQTTLVTSTTHGLATGDGPLVVATDTTLPGGLTADPERYWAEVVDANTIYLHTSREGAIQSAGPVDVTDAGTGAHTWAFAAEATSDIFSRLAQGDKAVTIQAATDIDNL